MTAANMRRSARAPRLAVTAGVALLVSAGCRPEPLPQDTADPPPAGPATVAVPASTAVIGGELEFRASGFAPNAAVQIGLGMPASDYDVIAERQTDARGELRATVTIPDWAMAGQRYVLVVTEPDHDPRAVSEPFTVDTR